MISSVLFSSFCSELASFDQSTNMQSALLWGIGWRHQEFTPELIIENIACTGLHGHQANNHIGISANAASRPFNNAGQVAAEPLIAPAALIAPASFKL